MKARKLIFFLAIILLSSTTTNAQQNTPPPSGFLPDAVWSGFFQKQLGGDIYSKYYSWQADLSIDLTIYRYKRFAINFNNTFETVGAEKIGPKITVADTTYLFGSDVSYIFSPNSKVKGGFEHLSSHTTNDLNQITLTELRRGETIPPFDSSDLNVLFVELYQSLPYLLLKPELNFRFQPIGLRFRTGAYSYDQPVYLKTQFTLIQIHGGKLGMGSRHEFGKDSFNDFIIQLELLAKKQKEGRFQLFIAGSPGHNLHVSPNIGLYRNGLRTGIRLVFYSD